MVVLIYARVTEGGDSALRGGGVWTGMTAVFGGVRATPMALDRRRMAVHTSRRAGAVCLGGEGGDGRCRADMTAVFQGTRAAPTAWDRRRAAVHI